MWRRRPRRARRTWLADGARVSDIISMGISTAKDYRYFGRWRCYPTKWRRPTSSSSQLFVMLCWPSTATQATSRPSWPTLKVPPPTPYAKCSRLQHLKVVCSTCVRHWCSSSSSSSSSSVVSWTQIVDLCGDAFNVTVWDPRTRQTRRRTSDDGYVASWPWRCCQSLPYHWFGSVCSIRRQQVTN